jgi:hypothetical protein
VSSIITELNFRTNEFLDVSIVLVTGHLKDGMYPMSPSLQICLTTAEPSLVAGRFSHLLQDKWEQRATVSHELRFIIPFLFTKIDATLTITQLFL